MRSLEVINKVLRSAEDLKSIVRTMKVLSAVSIHQYERAVESLVDYNRTVNLGIQIFTYHNDKSFAQPFSNGTEIGVVVFGSDHGLCGSFNEALATFALDKIKSSHITANKWRIVTVGARMSMVFEARKIEMDECFFIPGSVAEITASVRQLLIKLDGWQTAGVSKILLFFNKRAPSNRCDPTLLNLLPIDMDQFEGMEAQSWPSRSIPTYTMSDETLLSSLIRQYLFISIFQACAESLASEHASRLLSMQIAEKSIKGRIEDLRAEFRQQRQNSITEELLDVVAGFEVLNR